MANYQNILRQAHQAIADVADNADSWRAFLRSAAYTTHYAFPNQALIYSQRPGATMLADIDTWNRAAGRWVNRGAHGVASLGTGNMAGNVRYLFDIKDTHPAGKASKPLGWQITDANRYPTLQALQEKHSAESLPEIFGLQAALFVAQHGKQLDADLQNAVIGSTLEWAKPQEHAFRQFNLIGNRNSGGRWLALRCCGFGIYRLVTMGIASSAACACRLFMCAVQPNGSLFLSGAGLLTSSFVMVCSTCSQ